MSKTVAARIDEDLDAELDRLAQATGRSKSALVGEALRSYVASERQFIEAVEAGIRDLEAGRLVDQQTVVAAVRRAIRPRT
ncbi:MAG: ribbon-helix-helix protein, CopG family [Alphaproteobacteria bacterium]|nr:ribbon-helix-helix protein, CopG family [Alphaproteobacteria bacterium]